MRSAQQLTASRSAGSSAAAYCDGLSLGGLISDDLLSCLMSGGLLLGGCISDGLSLDGFVSDGLSIVGLVSGGLLLGGLISSSQLVGGLASSGLISSGLLLVGLIRDDDSVDFRQRSLARQRCEKMPQMQRTGEDEVHRSDAAGWKVARRTRSELRLRARTEAQLVRDAPRRVSRSAR